MSKVVTLVENDDGDLVLPISEDIVSHLGWSDGTIVQLIDNFDGTFTLQAAPIDDE